MRFHTRKYWKTKHKAKIDCENSHIPFSHEGIEYLTLVNESIQPVSASALMNDYNKGCQLFSVILRNKPVSNDSDVKNQEDISSVLDDNMDVFPEDLPKGLPPKRTETDFKIELKEDAKPVKKGLYRMSHSKLEETKKQVET